MIKVVQFEAVEWHVTPAAEKLREHAYDLDRRWGKVLDRILLMAGSKSDYFENKVQNQILGAVAFTAPTPVFFGLWGTAGSIGDGSNGGTANEVTGGSYDRVSMTNNTTNFATVGANTAKVNSVAIVFPTASANWNAAANLNQVGVLDGNLKTAGDNLLLWADLTVPKPVLNGDTPQFSASGFSYTED